MKRRLLCIFLLILIMSTAVYAKTSGTELIAILPDELPEAGEHFTVSINISGNPGLSAIQFALSYDKTLLECVDMTVDEDFGSMMMAANPAGADCAMISAASVSEVHANGMVVSFEFVAKQSLHDWNMELRNIKLTDGSLNEISAIDRTNQGHAATPDDTPGSGSDDKPDNDPGNEPDNDPGPDDKPDRPGKPDNGDPSGEKLPITYRDSNASTFAGFPDTVGHWAESYVKRAVELGLFSGMPDGTFHPDDPITRADFVTVLWRSAGSPEPTALSTFADVPADMYYAKAVAWAKENGYVDGVSATEFNPSGILERQAAMKILYYYNGAVSGMELLLTPVYDKAFTDSGTIAAWANLPMYWAYANNIITCTGSYTLGPTGHATRAQLAKILVNYLENYLKTQ